MFIIGTFCVLCEVGTKFYVLCNVASCVAYWQIYVNYVIIVFLNFYPFYISIFYYDHVPVSSGWGTNSGTRTTVLETVF
jgi:hypothetical protein